MVQNCQFKEVIQNRFDNMAVLFWVGKKIDEFCDSKLQ